MDLPPRPRGGGASPGAPPCRLLRYVGSGSGRHAVNDRDQTNHDLGGNGLGVSGPGGFSLRARGPVTILLVVLLVGLGGLAWLMRTDTLMRIGEHRTILEAQNNLACMLAIPATPTRMRLEAAMDIHGACHYIAQVYRFGETR